MDDLKMYMENLDEFVNDENKVVTYKWLSITLQIPCNTAKRLLHHFVSSQEKLEDKDDLHVTYLVMGTASKADGEQLHTKVCIVPRAELVAIKQSMDTVLCVHVYSVSKSKLKDQTATLYTADYDCVRQNLTTATEYGGLVCPAATLRSDADLASLRRLGTYRPSTPQDTRSAPDPRLAKPSEKATGDKLGTDDGKTAKQSVKAAGDKSKTAKSSLASMFATQTNTKKEPKENGDGEEKQKEDNTKKIASGKKAAADGKKTGGISGFFTKGVNLRESEIKNGNKDSDPGTKSPKKTGMKVEDESDEELAPIKKETTTLKKSPVKKTSPVKVKSNGRAKGKVATQPRRSRILQMDSDSSAEEGSGSESENECPAPSPPQSPPDNTGTEDQDEVDVPSPSSPKRSTSVDPHRGKKRKQIDKTYEEGGFLLTRKEYVYVTDSDPEDVIPSPPAKKQDRSSSSSPDKRKSAADTSPKSPLSKNKQPAKKAAPKKSAKNSPTKSKQASIMSFFKKK